MKKLLMDARSLGSKPSGVGIYIYNILKSLDRDKFSISLVTDVIESNEIKELGDSGMHIYSYGKKIDKNLSLYSYYKFIQKCIHEDKPDIFWEGNNLVPITLKNPYGKLYVTIHDMFPLSNPEYYGRVYPYYFKRGIKKTINTFDGFIYNSYNTKSEAKKYFPVLKEKDNIVSYIIVPRLPKIEINDNNCFLYVGNLEKRKGTDILLKAYRLYREKGGTKGLRLGGKVREDDIQELLDKTIKEVEGIEYLGYLTEEEKNKEYASCNTFLFPSRLEGFGIPVVEVMNYYKPVIASELDTIKEVVGDCITYINDDVDSLVKAMSEYSKEVDKEAYDKVIDKYTNESIGKLIEDYLVK